MKILTDQSQIDFQKLESFIYNHPDANFYQSTNAFNLFLSAKNYEPFLTVAYKDDKVVGSLLGVVVKDGKGIKGFMSRRCVVWGGPLVENNDAEIFQEIVYEFDKLAKIRSIYTEIREISRLTFEDQFKSFCYSPEDRLNILVDLKKNVDTLWTEMSSKRRNEIRKAKKEGTTVRELKEIEEVLSSYKIIKEVYDRAKIPLANRSLFEESFYKLNSKGLVRFFGAYNSGELIGAMYLLCYKKRAIDWYAGSKKEHYKKYPNDIIPWEVFKILKLDGFEIFDFGGAGKLGVPYGVRDYKKKFGGDFIQLKRYKKVQKPNLMRASEIGLKIWQIFK